MMGWFKKTTIPGRLFSVEGIKISGYAGDSSAIGAIRTTRHLEPKRPVPKPDTVFKKVEKNGKHGMPVNNESGSPERTWNELAPEWKQWAMRSGNDHYFYEYNWPQFQNLLPVELGTVLDVGCGEGRSSRELMRLGAEVVGVEQSSTLTEYAKQSGVNAITTGNDLPFPSRSFDNAVAFMVLHDTFHYREIIDDVYRVLKPGGMFAFSIIHPFAAYNSYQNNSEKPKSYWKEKDYQESLQHDDLEFTFHSIARPLQDYTEALTATGFQLEHLSEVKPSKTYLRDHPDAHHLKTSPLYLHVFTRKPVNNEQIR